MLPAGAAENLPVIKPIIACGQLSTLSLSNKFNAQVAITSAAVVKTEKGTFCRVTATVAPEIGIEVALPTEKWTQRFLQVGCGGLCGNINLNLTNASGCAPALNGEFTVAATNMGHSGSMMDARWAEDPQKRIDFAWRANHLTAKLTKALIAAYYGQSPKYVYFMGCSDGGREALMEAQRYPEDFDGISAGAPAGFFQFQNSFYHGWNVAANLRQDGSAILLKDRLPILHQAVLQHCPTLSGVDDGILQNPWACRFSADWVKQCAEHQQDKSNCLTLEEITVAENLYRGAHDIAGNQFVPGGLPLGSELRWPVPTTASGHSMSEMMVLPALQSVLLPGAKQNIASMKDFPLNRANFAAVAELAPLYNAANTDLHQYQQRGGKLLIWHGLADDSISPAFSIAYYRGVEKTLGAAAVNQFLRLFLLPGVGHCGRGEGYDRIDLLTPLMAWTEQGKAPEKIITGKPAGSAGEQEMPMLHDSGASAEKQFHGLQQPSRPYAVPAGAISATRPVWPYPYIARYSGKGSVNEAQNYRPVISPEFDRLTIGKPASDFIGPDNQKTYHVRDGKLVTD
ncbi:tannase/feruloyl esterase family alpha/beta hydrolase [Erwinia sp. D4-22]